MKTKFKSWFFSIFAILIFTLLMLISCEKENENDEIQLDGISMLNYPRVDGSTSTHPLQAVIACELLDIDYLWNESWFDETFRIWPIPDEKPDVAEFIRDSIVHNGTHSAYVNLITNLADIIIVARKPSQDEIDLADSMSVELVFEPIALDAFVFISNVKNPVNSLTEKQIQDIYMDNITNWNQVGGLDSPIDPYTRNVNSGSQELMETLVMKDLQMPDHRDMVIFGMMGVINAITLNENGLGYTVYYYEQFMAPNDSLKLIEVNNIMPNSTTLKNRQYEYTTEVYVVIRSDLSESSMTNKMYSWLQSNEGRKIIKESGYIPYQ